MGDCNMDGTYDMKKHRDSREPPPKTTDPKILSVVEVMKKAYDKHDDAAFNAGAATIRAMCDADVVTTWSTLLENGQANLEFAKAVHRLLAGRVLDCFPKF